MTMFEQICKSTATPGTTTSLHLRSFRLERNAILTLSRCTSFGSGGTFMNITLLPVVGSELLMEQGMDVDSALFYAATPCISSR